MIVEFYRMPRREAIRSSICRYEAAELLATIPFASVQKLADHGPPTAIFCP
jgi:hypothetical protein